MFAGDVSLNAKKQGDDAHQQQPRADGDGLNVTAGAAAANEDKVEKTQPGKHAR